MRLRDTAFLLATFTLIVGLFRPPTHVARAQGVEPIDVVATFSVLGDIVARVGGDRVGVTVLIPSGTDAHIFEPTPEDAGTLENAAVLFENGFGFEPWLDQLYEAAASDAARVVVSDGIQPRGVEGDAHEGDEEAHDDDDEGDHDHGEFDPHVWHDVQHVILEVETIRAALGAADPANATVYDANAAAYTAELQDLDAYVVEEVAAIPEDQRLLVTSHDTFGYFADRYGFTVIGTAFGSVSTEGGDPSAQQINELIDTVEETGVPAIFAENVANSSVMDAIAAETGVTLAPPLYTDALGEPGSPGETYVGMIRSNVDTIVGALSV